MADEELTWSLTLTLAQITELECALDLAQDRKVAEIARLQDAGTGGNVAELRRAHYRLAVLDGLRAYVRDLMPTK